MAKYKVEISGLNTNYIKTLSNDVTLNLIKEYKNTNSKKIKDQIIHGNFKLVLSVVNKFQKRTDNLDDLFQIGVIGLIKAIDNFSLEHKVKFSTYAVPMIEGEIRRYLRDNSFLRISRQIKDLSYQVLKEKEHIVNEYGHIPSLEELSKKFSVDKKKIIEALDANMPLSSLNDTLRGEDDEALTLMDIIPETDNSDEKILLRISLHQGLEKLPEIERKIIKMRYYEDKSQVEIASLFDISQAQVSRLEKSAIEFLRKFV
ncbi:rNA polymerase sigma factor [Firmicutes bacterium CAG:449]|nr:rNA polymerase sigma factor [Firmicutes bacterium CAG:449]